MVWPAKDRSAERPAVDRYASLFEVAKLLLSQDHADGVAETLFRRVLELTAADRGFLVVREGESYEQKLDLRFDRNEVTSEERRFSRSLVRRAIESREVLVSQNLLEDPRFARTESVEHVGACSVLVVPLHHEGEVYGVVYLDQQGGPRGFRPEAVQVMTDVAELAGLFIRRAVEREALRRRTASLERDFFAQHDFEGIVTQDPRLLDVLKVVAQVADSSATILVGGETGTGKELVARALHANSRRRHKPFIALHCTALPATILESELFGHVRGAFTGADRDRPGRIATANGGTLFLDEIAEIAPEVQAKLLRFLQFGELQRLGSDRTEKVDVRVVAATHRDLRSLVERGKFRQDLYFRLKVIEVDLPPLRDREGDVELLALAFLQRHWKRSGPRPRFTARALALLDAYPWPGNVRELAHAVERACVLSSGPELDVDLLPPELVAVEPEEVTGVEPPSRLPAAPATMGRQFTSEELERLREEAVVAAERDFLQGLTDRWAGNISAAARESGIHRSYLQRLLSKHGLRSG